MKVASLSSAHVSRRPLAAALVAVALAGLASEAHAQRTFVGWVWSYSSISANPNNPSDPAQQNYNNTWGSWELGNVPVTVTVRWRGSATAPYDWVPDDASDGAVGTCANASLFANDYVWTASATGMTDANGHYSITVPGVPTSQYLYGCVSPADPHHWGPMGMLPEGCYNGIHPMANHYLAPIFETTVTLGGSNESVPGRKVGAIVQSSGDTTSWHRYQYINTKAACGTSVCFGGDVQRAPVMVSPSGAFWARRFGDGPIPIFFIEGFDAGDTVKTSGLACPGGVVNPGTCDGMQELLQATPIGGGRSFFDFLATPSDLHQYPLNKSNYSFYVIANSGNSTIAYRGTTANGVPEYTGQAYQAMRLIKSVYSKFHAGKPMVVGGYSAGGVVAKVGLQKWCSGYWHSATGGVLDSGCANVALWFAADAPLRGAAVPVSLQRYMCDSRISNASNCWKMDNPAASELLHRWVHGANGACYTNCSDPDGCDSTDSDFSDGLPDCYVDTGPRTAFVNWQKDTAGTLYPPPKQGTKVIPSVAFSLGGNPAESWQQTTCSAASGSEFLHTTVDCWVDHRLFVNTAGGEAECGNGSVLDSLASVDGVSGSAAWCPGGVATAHVYWYPTFVKSQSALESCTGSLASCVAAPSANHKDYWYNSAHTRNHFGAMPQAAASMTAAWISEYTVGKKTRPVCGHPYRQIGLKSPTNCRQPTSEIGGTPGVDDDGDGIIDDFPGSGNSGCGDGYCDVDERTYCACAADCGKLTTCARVPTTFCGNGVCEAGENTCTGGCPGDCGLVCPTK